MKYWSKKPGKIHRKIFKKTFLPQKQQNDIEANLGEIHCEISQIKEKTLEQMMEIYNTNFLKKNERNMFFTKRRNPSLSLFQIPDFRYSVMFIIDIFFSKILNLIDYWRI